MMTLELHRFMHLTATHQINEAEALAFSCHSLGMSIPGIRPTPKKDIYIFRLYIGILLCF